MSMSVLSLYRWLVIIMYCWFIDINNFFLNVQNLIWGLWIWETVSHECVLRIRCSERYRVKPLLFPFQKIKTILVFWGGEQKKTTLGSNPLCVILPNSYPLHLQFRWIHMYTGGGNLFLYSRLTSVPSYVE